MSRLNQSSIQGHYIIKMKAKDIVFEEFQRLKRKYVLLLLAPIDLLFITGCIIQIGFGKPMGNNPIPNIALIIITVALLLLTMIGLFLYLRTLIDSEGVHIRIGLCPFLGKSSSYLWDDISESHIINPANSFKLFRKARLSIKLIRIGPIQHGVFEIGPDGTKLIMSGNIGLQLILKNGKKVLIGTNASDELSDTLRKLGKLNDERQ